MHWAGVYLSSGGVRRSRGRAATRRGTLSGFARGGTHCSGSGSMPCFCGLYPCQLCLTSIAKAWAADPDCRRIWLGDHVEYANQLPGVREYVIDFVTDAPKNAPSAIATLRFDTREALEAAFGDPYLKENLTRTREQFAEDVQVVIVNE